MLTSSTAEREGPKSALNYPEYHFDAYPYLEVYAYCRTSKQRVFAEKQKVVVKSSSKVQAQAIAAKARIPTGNSETYNDRSMRYDGFRLLVLKESKSRFLAQPETAMTWRTRFHEIVRTRQIPLTRTYLYEAPIQTQKLGA